MLIVDVIFADGSTIRLHTVKLLTVTPAETQTLAIRRPRILLHGGGSAVGHKPTGAPAGPQAASDSDQRPESIGRQHRLARQRPTRPRVEYADGVEEKEDQVYNGR